MVYNSHECLFIIQQKDKVYSVKEDDVFVIPATQEHSETNLSRKRKRITLDNKYPVTQTCIVLDSQQGDENRGKFI